MASPPEQPSSPNSAADRCAPLPPPHPQAPNDPDSSDLDLELAAFLRSLHPQPQLRGAPPPAAGTVVVSGVRDGMLTVDIAGAGLCAWRIPPRGFGLLTLLELAAHLRVPVAWLAAEIVRCGGGEDQGGEYVGVWAEAVCSVWGE